MRLSGLRLGFIFVVLATGVLARAQTLTVLAAASLRESFSALAKDFERSHPGVNVRITFAGSQQLAASILLGAPADVFASADEVQMARVLEAGKGGSRGVLCSNRLVIAVSAAARGKVNGVADLGVRGLRLVLAKQAVPAGAYAEKVLAKLPSAEASAIRNNVRSREPDVRTVLTRIELGEADAGIVYATDVAAKPGSVKTVQIPDRLQTPVAYMIGIVNRTTVAKLADAFISLTLSKSGQHVLRVHGFLPPPTGHSRK
jgi:molybdate transport system substrate-binding protein